MPRKRTALQNEYPYHVSARTNNREWFNLPMRVVWEIYVNEVKETSLRYGFISHAFVLMNNHFHWLVSTPNSNLGEGMRYFMTETSRKIARACGRINKIYGARYKPTLIRSDGHYMNAFRYVYQNPLRAKICNSVDEYPWSTAASDEIPIASLYGFHQLIPKDPNEFQIWLNTPPDPIHNGLVRRALRRTVFKFPRHPTSKERPSD